MEIVVKGRHTEVPERFRHHVEDKLARVGRLDPNVTRIDVEVTEERNKRLADQSHRIELTCLSRGPVIRAEAAAADPYGALDLALARLEGRLRRSTERRQDRFHGKSGSGRSVVVQPDAGAGGLSAMTAVALGEVPEGPGEAYAGDDFDVPPLVVREKSHQADPMTTEQALFALEMVGHDFFLYYDVDVQLPSVVYRRRGYQYGVIRLTVDSPS